MTCFVVIIIIIIPVLNIELLCSSPTAAVGFGLLLQLLVYLDNNQAVFISAVFDVISSMLFCISMVRCCPTLNNYMNFSDTEGVYTHTFEAERNVCVSVCLSLSVCVRLL